jgi:hypothetical protein
VHKLITSFFFITLLPVATYSQTLTLEAIATEGDFKQKDGYSLSYTIGECSVRPNYIMGQYFTEGFQQGEKRFIPVDSSYVKAYPNPITDNILYVVLPVKNEINSYFVRIFSMGGRILYSRRLVNMESTRIEEFSFYAYPRGLYFIKVQAINGQFMKSFKVEKL